MVRSEMEILCRAAGAAAVNMRFLQLLEGKSAVLREQQEALDQMKIENQLGGSKEWPGYQIVESLNPIYTTPFDRAN